MKTFRFNRFGEQLGTRAQGAAVRAELLETIESNETTVLDFEGVNILSNSFADECIAKLLLHYPLDELKKRTTFRNLTPFARRCIAVALSRRQLALNAV